MANTDFQTQPQPPFASPQKPSNSQTSKSKKPIGQCPTCNLSFTTRHELHAHMSDPQTHPPVSDSDAISFGELSSDYDSLDEDPLPKPSASQASDEPTLEDDGFEFTGDGAPDMERDGFEFSDTGFSSFEGGDYGHGAEQGSVHTMHDEGEQPSTDYTSFDSTSHPRTPRSRTETQKGALGVLYCGTCDKYFGNEKAFKRHFMFGIKHGEEPRDMREMYYRVWGKTWAEEAREVERVRSRDVDAMEL